MPKRSPVSWTRRMVDLLKVRMHSSSRAAPTRSRDAKILSQIKFYFSDANLRRDAYMHNLFAQDPFGWLSVFELKTFPILKSLNTTEYDILRLCSADDFFVVNVSSVRRNFDLYPNGEILSQLSNRSAPPPEQMSLTEKRTVFVDRIPVALNHERLKNLLIDQFDSGKINIKYVSIPRHAVTGESFGCAYIELDSESQARYFVRKLRYISDSSKVDYRRTVSANKCYVRAMTMRKFKSLKAEYLAAKKLTPKNRLCYFEGYSMDKGDDSTAAEDKWSSAAYDGRETGDNREMGSVVASALSETTSSVVGASEVDSLAHESIDVRRSRNASSIRSNSVVLLEQLPGNANYRSVHLWLSHSASVQFLDYADGDPSGYARFASRRERDFFLTDFAKGKLSLCGSNVCTARALTAEECADYFEAERERRRSQIGNLGHPDSWATPNSTKKGADNMNGNDLSKKPSSTTSIAVAEGWAGRAHRLHGFTDTVMGNASRGEPGSSILCGIKKARHVAREFIKGKRLMGDNDQMAPKIVEHNALKRAWDETSDCSPSKRQRTGETANVRKTRRGKRGGVRVRMEDRHNT